MNVWTLRNILFIRRIASLNHIIKTKNAPLISSPNSRKYMSQCPRAHLCVPPWVAIPKLFHSIIQINQVGKIYVNTCLGLVESEGKGGQKKTQKLPNCERVPFSPVELNRAASKQVVSPFHFLPFLHQDTIGSMNNRWEKWWDQSEAISLGDRSGQSRT